MTSAPLILCCGFLNKHNTNSFLSNYQTRYFVLTSTAIHWFVKPTDSVSAANKANSTTSSTPDLGSEGNSNESVLFGVHRGSISLSAITNLTLKSGTISIRTDEQSYIIKKASSLVAINSPSVDKWYETINRVRAQKYARRSSMSGTYLPPAPHVSLLVSPTTVIARDISYNQPVKGPAAKSLTVLLSDGSQTTLSPSASSSITFNVLPDTTATLSYSPSFSLPRFLLLPLIPAISAALLRMNSPGPVEAHCTAVVIVYLILTHMFPAPSATYKITLNAEKVQHPSEEDIEADAVMASASVDEHTCLVSISDKFSSACVDGKIMMPQLLEAAEAFLEILRALGPAMALGVKDFQGNLKKAHLQYDKDTTAFADLKSLLEGEKATGIHKPGGMNADPSSAAGLLWMRRSITFQLAIFENMLAEPDNSLTVSTNKAYKDELEPFHAWLLKSIFTRVISNVPSKEGFAEKLAPSVQEFHRQAIVTKDMKDFVERVGPVVKLWKKIFGELGLEDTRKV